MTNRRAVGRFAGAAVLCCIAIVVAVAISDGARQTATPDATEPTTTPLRPEPTASTTAPSKPTIPTPPPRTPLPRPDFAEFCRAQFGETFVVVEMPGDGIGCAPQQSAVLPRAIDTARVCADQVGPTSRAIPPSVDPTWRCSVDPPALAGKPDFELGCHSLYGPTANAALSVHDVYGWRCAFLQNGLFTTAELSVDAMCALRYGPDVFSGSVDSTTDGWRCYGAA